MFMFKKKTKNRRNAENLIIEQINEIEVGSTSVTNLPGVLDPLTL